MHSFMKKIFSKSLSWKDFIILIFLQIFSYLAMAFMSGFVMKLVSMLTEAYHQYNPSFPVIPFTNNYTMADKILGVVALQIGTVIYSKLRSKYVLDALKKSQINKLSLFIFGMDLFLTLLGNGGYWYSLFSKEEITMIFMIVIILLLRNLSSYIFTFLFLIIGNKLFYKKIGI